MVVTANGGQAGIDAFHTARKDGNDFSVVITDLGMPHVDGRRLAAAVKATSPPTPVILLTGWGSASSPRATFRTTWIRCLASRQSCAICARP